MWMLALDLQGAEHGADGHQQSFIPGICSVLCSWLSPETKLYLKILGKHLAPLWHSKTCRCHLARLPARSSPPLLPPWQKQWSCCRAGDVLLAG